MKPLLTYIALAVCAGTIPTQGAAGVCVTNGSEHRHFFVAEAAGGPRDTAWLAASETLCAAASGTTGGVVSVFESDSHQEGCSRLVSGSETETLLKYVDFDRCFWSSNTN